MSETSTGRALARGKFTALVALALLLGSFSLFVGYNKAFAPIEVLREHSAWTIHLPFWLGRTVGWLELTAATALWLGLVLKPLAKAGLAGAAWITLGNVVAAVVHVIHAEWHTLTQSAVVITLCLVMTALYRRHAAIGRRSGN